ncbi:hypothetical protein ACWFRK_36910 [Streptomyces sp. NPDC055157]
MTMRRRLGNGPNISTPGLPPAEQPRLLPVERVVAAALDEPASEDQAVPVRPGRRILGTGTAAPM